MKLVRLFFVAHLLATPYAIANNRSSEFSGYTCDFVKLPNASNWHVGQYTMAEYSTTMGWNQTAYLSKAILAGMKTGEFGICSEVSSHSPEQIYLNTFVIEGSGLNMEGGGCTYSGKEVKVKHFKRELSSNSEYLSNVTVATLDGLKHSFLHIAGVRPKVDDDVVTLCENAFHEVTGAANLRTTKAKDFLLQRGQRTPKSCEGFCRYWRGKFESEEGSGLVSVTD